MWDQQLLSFYALVPPDAATELPARTTPTTHFTQMKTVSRQITTCSTLSKDTLGTGISTRARTTSSFTCTSKLRRNFCSCRTLLSTLTSFTLMATKTAKSNLNTRQRKCIPPRKYLACRTMRMAASSRVRITFQLLERTCKKWQPMYSGKGTA